MKKTMIPVAAFFAGLFLFSCSSAKKTGNVGMPNPFIECENPQRAYSVAGFKMTIPESLDSPYMNRIIRAINGNLIEVIYKNPSDLKDEVRLRKAFGEDDVSGDWNKYPVNKNIEISGKKVLLRGEENNFHVASWKVGKFAYAVISRKGLSESSILKVAAALE